MKTIPNLLSFAALLATAQIAPAAVPSTINYQGRLTNALGVVQTGTKSMSLKIYDAATAGTQLYAETIGNVTLDTNGVYGFQFGAAGTSDTLITETVATTDGTTLTYQKTLSNTPVLPGTVSVTDGTYSWNEITGNPGTPASATANVVSGFVVGATVTNGGSGYGAAPAVTITGNGSGAAATATVSSGAVSGITITNAGSNYTTGATISIAPPPAPFVINYSGGTITATYASPPAAGQTITATYRYSANGISSALAAGAEQWLELTVDGIAQTPRQKVLAVPFAMNAAKAQTAVALEKKIRTRQLANWTKVSTNNAPPNSLLKLPLTTTYGQSIYRFIEPTATTIEELSCMATITNQGLQYPANVTVELASYSVTGSRAVVASQARLSTGQLKIVGPFNLEHSQYEYVIECYIDGGFDSTSNVRGQATMNPLAVKYMD